MIKPEFIVGAEAVSGDKLQRARKWREGFITANSNVVIHVVFNIYTDGPCEQYFAVSDALSYDETGEADPITFTYPKDVTDFKDVVTHVMDIADKYYIANDYYDDQTTERFRLHFGVFKFMACLINPDNDTNYDDIKITNYANLSFSPFKKEEAKKPESPFKKTELYLKVIDETKHIYGLIPEGYTDPSMTFKVVHDPGNKTCCVRTFADILYSGWGSFFNLSNPRSNPGVAEMVKFVFDELVKHLYPKDVCNSITLDEVRHLSELAYECVHKMINEV